MKSTSPSIPEAGCHFLAWAGRPVTAASRGTCARASPGRRIFAWAWGGDLHKTSRLPPPTPPVSFCSKIFGLPMSSARISLINALLLLLTGTQALRSNYVRLFKSTADAVAPAYELQTADVRLTLRDDGGVFSVDLLSTVHVAEREYYRDLQARGEQYDRTLFELIVDGSLVTTQQDEATGTQVRRLSTPLRAAPALKELAARNGLDTQVEALDCTRARWVLADVTRRQLSVQEARLQQPGLARGRNTLAPGFGTLAAPLRLLLVGPTGSNKNSQSSALRPLLSFLPAPELCWLLDDWITAGEHASAHHGAWLPCWLLDDWITAGGPELSHWLATC